MLYFEYIYPTNQPNVYRYICHILGDPFLQQLFRIQRTVCQSSLISSSTGSMKPSLLGVYIYICINIFIYIYLWQIPIHHISPHHYDPPPQKKNAIWEVFFRICNDLFELIVIIWYGILVLMCWVIWQSRHIQLISQLLVLGWACGLPTFLVTVIDAWILSHTIHVWYIYLQIP